MTAPRECRACGARVPGAVRWCGLCQTPIQELTPREPVWREGEFVDQPIHRGGAISHWSRWEKSATTFGPLGRVAITMIAALWVLSAAGQSPITLVFVLPLVVVLVRSVWQRGWVVPKHLAAKEPERIPQPIWRWHWDRRELWRSLALGVVWLAGGAVLIDVEDPIPRFIVVVTAVVALAAWAFRKVGER
jgi:hypothetical protein